MSDDQDKVIYVSLDYNAVYYNYNDNAKSFPVKIKGHEWTALWWMYRLSERNCKFQEYLAEYIIPICRKYFIEEKRRPKDDPDPGEK